ncbi:hypothetical protein CFN17_19515 [Arthrobacter sp. PM3]|nr:hypothetical protein CFN17_19515 [Arthrobacter sp. PM3]
MTQTGHIDLRFDMEPGPPEKISRQALDHGLRLRHDPGHDPTLPDVVSTVEPLAQSTDLESFEHDGRLGNDEAVRFGQATQALDDDIQ